MARRTPTAALRPPALPFLPHAPPLASRGRTERSLTLTLTLTRARACVHRARDRARVGASAGGVSRGDAAHFEPLGHAAQEPHNLHTATLGGTVWSAGASKHAAPWSGQPYTSAHDQRWRTNAGTCQCRSEAAPRERASEGGRAENTQTNTVYGGTSPCGWLSTREYSVQPGALRTPQPAHRRAPVRRPPLPREYSSNRSRPPLPREYSSTRSRPPSAVVGYLVSWHARATRPQLHGDSVWSHAARTRPTGSDRSGRIGR